MRPGSASAARVTIDADTARVLVRAPFGCPDGLAYVLTLNQVRVSDEDGGAETVLDAANGQRVATVPLGGEAGNVRYDPAGARVLVDVQTANQVAILDPRSRAIVRRVPVPGCDQPMSPAATRLRRVVAHSPMMQILLFCFVLVAVLLLAEYLGIFGG